jgi:PAS domain S-box-containing protein
MKYSLVVVVLGAVGILASMQWTAYSVRRDIGLASQSVFPAALDSQRAGTAFERMTHDYSDAFVMQDKASLARAGAEAATVTASLDRAAKFMTFNPSRQEEILSLRSRVTSLQARSKIDCATGAGTGGTPPSQREMADLSRENKAAEMALETLQNDLAGDFRNELTLIDRLLTVEGILQAVVFVGVIAALFFGIRSLIQATIQKREGEIQQQVHSMQERERNVLRALIDNIPDFMYVKDADSRFIVANAHLAHAAGADSPEKLLGRMDFDFFPRENASDFFEDEQGVMRTGQPLYNREEMMLDSAGNEIQILTTKVPLRDGTGKVIGIAGVGRDITERKKMEIDLREAEQKYRGIFDNAIFGVFQTTPDGRLLSANHAMAVTWGYASVEEGMASAKANDIAGKVYVDPERRKEFQRLMEENGAVQNFEYEAYRKDGGRIWLSMSATAIRENGVVVRYEGMSEDITERRALREQLLQAQKLESVGQLAAGIAHEINTPTQYIGDNVRFLKDAFEDLKSLLASYERRLSASGMGGSSPAALEETAAEGIDVGYLLDEVPKAIDQSLEGVGRVSALVNAMKEFSHPDTREKAPMDLNRAIAATITVARNEWKYVADMETHFDSSLPPVPCHTGEINQVVLNLIVNAAHAIGDAARQGGRQRGTITIETHRCVEWAEIRITDTGTGIPEEVRTRVFDPFFTTKEVGKGTGQGLAIARSVVVDKHGGSLQFETEEGTGTTFIVRLPYDGKALPMTAVAA